MSFFDWSDVLDEAEEVQKVERAAISITAHSLKTAGGQAAAAAADAASPTGRRWSITTAAVPPMDQPASPTVSTYLMAGQPLGCSAATMAGAAAPIPSAAAAPAASCRAAAADIEAQWLVPPPMPPQPCSPAILLTATSRGRAPPAAALEGLRRTASGASDLPRKLTVSMTAGLRRLRTAAGGLRQGAAKLVPTCASRQAVAI